MTTEGSHSTALTKALGKLKKLGESYGFDISRPAMDTKEAFQWVYFGYLAAVKEQNGAAMSLGRVSTFLDIYAQRDLEEGRYTETEIQEIVDDFIMKLRIIRFLRTPAYDELFSGDPNWVTESIGGIGADGRHMVTKMSFRFLHTLTNLGPAPEPNMTVLWSIHLPENFKKYCAAMSIKTCSIQYESDRIMRKRFGDDYGIACCVSAMVIGKQMQYFGARANLAKALLYAINGGRDEKSGLQIGPELLACRGTYLDYEDVMRKYDVILDWLAALYVNTLNVIHYMHDKYCYEKIQMALPEFLSIPVFSGFFGQRSGNADGPVLGGIQIRVLLPESLTHVVLLHFAGFVILGAGFADNVAVIIHVLIEKIRLGNDHQGFLIGGVQEFHVLHVLGESRFGGIDEKNAEIHIVQVFLDHLIHFPEVFGRAQRSGARGIKPS